MNDTVEDPVDRRSVPARVGVAALNLILPGLGLIRVGDRRGAVLTFMVQFALAALVTFGLGHLPITGYGVAVAALMLVIALPGAVYSCRSCSHGAKAGFAAPNLGGRAGMRWR